VHERLQELFDGVRLTPTQRRIAQCLLDQGTAAAYLSSGELADLAGVSQPSVTRFATALGYGGYPGLRHAVRVAVGAPRPPAVPGSDPTPARNELQAAVAGEVAGLDRLVERLADGTGERAAVADAARLLAGSRPLPVLGLRAAGPLAQYFGYFASKLLPDVRMLTEGGSLLGDRLEQARAAGATAMLGVVLPRYPREAVEALRDARAAGLAVVLITDSPVSPAVPHADVTLTAPVGSRLVFDLYTAPMTLAMVLLHAICDTAVGETQRRLEEFDSSAARRAVFLP